MIYRRFILRDLWFYRKTCLILIAVSIVSSAILTGALLTGASIKESLRLLSRERLGSAVLMVAADREPFRQGLAAAAAEGTGMTTAPVFRTRGFVTAPESGLMIHNVSVYGVDHRFWEIWGGRDPLPPGSGGVLLNPAAAARLGLSPGDELLLRLAKQQAMPAEAPLSLSDLPWVGFRTEVLGVVPGQRGGNFSPEPNQLPSPAVFVPLELLAGLLDMPGKANLLLSQSGDAQALRRSLTDAFDLEDAGLILLEPRQTGDGWARYLTSRRVFLDPPIEDLIIGITPPGTTAETYLSYFVNKIEGTGAFSPYSFVSSLSDRNSALRSGEIILSGWLAEDLGASGPGDSITLRYFVPGEEGLLFEETARFTVKEILPITHSLFTEPPAPDFPGITASESCAAWSPGIPIDLNLIREVDEDFWETYGPLPKALVSREDSIRLWGNRFGHTTALRFTAASRGQLEESLIEAARAVQEALPGVEIRNLVLEADRAAGGAVDFGSLFLGMSFFLILGAALLSGLAYSFQIETRKPQMLLLRALGYDRGAIREILLIEGLLICTAGGLLGVPAGIGVTRILLFAISTVWSGALEAETLFFSFTLFPPVIGFLGGGISAFLGLFFPLLAFTRSQGRPSTRISGSCTTGRVRRRSARPYRRLLRWSAPLLFVIALALPFLAGKGSPFLFLPGGLLMLSGWTFLFYGLLFPGKAGSPGEGHRPREGTLYPGVSRLIGGLRRNGKRNLAAALILALGVFIVTAAGAHRRDPFSGAHLPSSGTGGYTYFIRSTAPLPRDLNTSDGRFRHGLEQFDRNELLFTGLRLMEGEDAGCLNVYQAENPSLLGVDFAELSDRDSFSFRSLLGEKSGKSGASGWALISSRNNDEAGERVIPGVLDHSVLQWGLGKSLGDRLLYIDEYGEPFEIEIAGTLEDSVFQGSVLIREEDFLRFFPSSPGYHLLLADAGGGLETISKEALAAAFRNYGTEILTGAERLALFLRVENTYLSMFFVLGGLGLLLGSFGLGLVVAKNLEERKTELALMNALGYPKKMVQALLYREYLLVTVGGIAAGVTSALLAAGPTVFGGKAPVPLLAAGLGVLLCCSILLLYIAIRALMKKDALQTLREE